MDPIFAGGMLRPNSPSVVGNLFAWYDFSLGSSLTVTPAYLLTNIADISGNSPAGQRDLSQGVTAAKPQWLYHSGSNYGFLRGISGDYFSTPDSTTIETAAGFTSEVKVSLPNWTPAAACVLHAKWTDGANRSWIWLLDTASKLTLQVSADGSTIATAATSTTAVSSLVAAGQSITLRCIYVADNGSAQRTTTYQYSLNDGVSWTTIDSTITQAGAVSLFNGTSALSIGAQGSGTLTYAGSAGLQVYSATLKNSVGTLVSSFSLSSYITGSTFVATTGETWTLNGGSYIVTRTGASFDGVDDELVTSALTMNQPMTIYLIGEQITWTLNRSVYCGYTSGQCFTTPASPGTAIFAGAQAGNLITWVLRASAVHQAVFNGASSFAQLNRQAPTITTNVGAGNFGGFYLASSPGGGFWANLFISELAIFNTAHDQVTRNRLALGFSRKWRFTV